MKINIPQKFPKWLSGQSTLYTPDVIRTRNVRMKELSLTGEIDVKNTLSLVNNYDSLVSCIFREPNHLLSFATKDKMYYIDKLDNPTVTEYDPQIGTNLNPESTGVVVYPKGYVKMNNGDLIASSGNISTANIDTFADVPDRTRSYSYTSGQRVLAVRFQFAYTQSSGTNISRLVITDANGDHIVATEDEHSGGRGWEFWVMDGEAGCNLNGPNGFTAKVQVATSAADKYINFSSGDYIHFLQEMEDTQLLTTSVNHIYARYDNGSTDTYHTWYPGASIYDSWKIKFGYDQYQSIFSENYPTILKMFNDKILMIGNANSLHTVATSGTHLQLIVWYSQVIILLNGLIVLMIQFILGLLNIPLHLMKSENQLSCCGNQAQIDRKCMMLLMVKILE